MEGCVLFKVISKPVLIRIFFVALNIQARGMRRLRPDCMGQFREN